MVESGEARSRTAAWNILIGWRRRALSSSVSLKLRQERALLNALIRTPGVATHW